MAKRGFTRGMRSLPLAGTLAATAAVAGTAFLGASLDGMAHVDRELKAATAPAPVARFDRVVYVPAAGGGDCPRPRHHTRPEL